MKPTIRMAALLAALLCVAASFAQTKNPEEILQSINQLRTQRITEARNSGARLDLAALNQEIAAKVEEAIKGVDPAKVEAAQGYAWAQLFSIVGKHKEACDLSAKFLTTGPAPDQKFAAQMLMLNSCDALGEGDMIAMTLPGVVAPNPAASQALLRAVVGSYANTINKERGVEAAFRAIDEALAQVKFEAPEDYAKRMFESTKARAPKNRDGSAMTDEQITAQLVTSGKSVNESLVYSAIDRKAQILIAADRKKEAQKLLEDYVAKAEPGSAFARRASSELKKMTLVGAPAIPLKFDRKYGEYPGLDQWKGKVVIIDFTAHW